jgi:hypothetical protein
VNFTIEPGFPPHPQCYRAVCEVCGVGDRPGVRVIRLISVEIDHHDAAYTPMFVCELCIAELAGALGFLSASESAALREVVEEAQLEVLDLRADLDGLKEVEAVISQFVAKAAKPKVVCPECGEERDKQGLNLHRRQAHGVGK